MDEKNQNQDPIKKVSQEKVSSHLKSFFEDNGYDANSSIVKSKIDAVVADPDQLESNIKSLYSIYYDKGDYSQVDYKSILSDMYETQPEPVFVPTPEAEKKNSIQTQEGLESASTSVLEKPSSELSYDKEKSYISNSNLFGKIVNSIDANLISDDPYEAQKYLNSKLSNYGYSFDVDESVKGSSLSITGPNGERQNFRIYDEEYSYLPGQTTNLDQLKEIRVEQLKNYLRSNKTNELGFTIQKFRGITRDRFLPEVDNILKDGIQELYNPLSELTRSYYDIVDMGSFADKGIINPTKAIDGLVEIKNKLSDKEYTPKAIRGTLAEKKFDRKAALSEISDMISKVNSSIVENSEIMGNILAESGAYKYIDLSSPIELQVYSRMGLSLSDIPTEAIMIDGKASTLNRAYQILYDFDKVNDIRDGKGHDIQITDPKLAGLLSTQVDRVKETIKIQKATKSELADVPYVGSLLRMVENQAFRSGDIAQSIFFSATDVLKNLGVLYKEGLETLGFKEEDVDKIVYGNLPGFINFRGLRPETIAKAREDVIPYWSGDYVESLNKGELFSEKTLERASQDLSSSILNTAAFFTNIPLGLGMTFVGDAGERMTASEQRIKSLREKRDSGARLSTDEKDILETPEIVSNLYSLGYATKNTAITGLFTGRLVKNLKSIYPRGGVNVNAPGTPIRDFYNQYAKFQHRSLIRSLSHKTGLHPRVLSTEVMEEELIAASDYFVDVQLGYREWNTNEFNRILGNTAAISFFNSLTIGVAANLTGNAKAQRLGKSLVAGRIIMPGELLATEKKIDLSKRIEDFEDAAKNSGVDLTNDNTYQALVEENEKLNTDIIGIIRNKTALVEQMSRIDRAEIIRRLSKIEGHHNTISGTSDLDVIDRSKKEIEKEKEAVRVILQNQATEASFHFASEATRDEITRIAAMTAGMTSEEAKEASYGSLKDDAKVMAEAEKIYVQRVKDRQIKNENESDVDDFFGVLKTPGTTMTEYNEVANLNAFSEISNLYDITLEQHNQAKATTLDEMLGINQSEEAQQASTDIANLNEAESEIQQRASQKDAEIDELAGMYFDLQEKRDQAQADETKAGEVPTIEEEMSSLVTRIGDLIDDYNNIIDESESNADVREEFTSTLATKRLSDALTSRREDVANRDRISTIFGKIDRLGKQNFIEGLSVTDRANFQKFLTEVNQSGKAVYGPVDAMIEAQERINEIKSRAGGKIKIDNSGASKTLGALVDISRRLATIKGYTTATKDVLSTFLFRDKNVGKSFFEVYNNIATKFSAVNTKTGFLKKQHEKQYREDAKKESSLTGRLFKKGFDPNSLDNSIEMFALSVLGRKVESDPTAGKVIDSTLEDGKPSETRVIPEGKTVDFDLVDPDQLTTNSEFERVRTLIIEEGDLLRAEAFGKKGTAFQKKKSKAWDQMISKLGLLEAKTFEEVKAKASLRNLNAVERMSSMFDSDLALERIRNFERHEPTTFVKGTYVPMLMKVRGVDGSDFNVSTIETLAGSLKNTTRPSSLMGGEIRLNTDMFFDNIYARYRSTEMDIQTKKDLEVFASMVNSPSFEAIFEDADSKTSQNLINAFRDIKPQVQKEIALAGSVVYDVESMTDITKKLGSVGKDIEQATLANVSATALVRMGQPLYQFFSAGFAGISYMNSQAARNIILQRMGAFPFFSARLMDGNAPGFESNMIARFFGLGDNSTGKGRLHNIYANSRTGARNSIFAETGVTGNKKLPISYYLTQLGIDPKSWADAGKHLGTYTLDQAINILKGSAEISLEFFVARPDRLASNMVFEAAYLDYRLKQGEVLPRNKNEWWAKENESPNKEAIAHADNIVATMMKTTESFTDADIYSADAKSAVKFGVRSFLPFGRFIMNAKTDIAANLAILNDPRIDPEQKEQARQRIGSRAVEIITYNALKFSMNSAMIGGMIIPRLLIDEDDIERLGGMTKLIGTDILPIESRYDFEVAGVSVNDAETIEQRNAIIRASQSAIAGMRELNSAADDLNKLTLTFDDKFKLGNQYSVVKQTLQDLGFSMFPIPLPGPATELLGREFNNMYNDEVFQEFISKDIENLDTKGQVVRFIIENSGIYGMAVENIAAFARASSIKNDLQIKKDPGETGQTRILHLNGYNDKIREKLVAATDALYVLRFMSLTMPGLRGDLDRIADKLERTIEDRFTSTIIDPKLLMMADESSMMDSAKLLTGIQEKEYEPVSAFETTVDESGNEKEMQMFPVKTFTGAAQGPVNQTQQQAPVQQQATNPKKTSIDTEGLGYKFETAQGSLGLPIEGAIIKERPGLLEDENYGSNVITRNRGVVLSAKSGSPVKTVFDGQVIGILKSPQGKYGVIVKHGDYSTTYFGTTNPSVKKGDTIPAGTIIGNLIGKEGSDADLRFYVYKGEYVLNPEEWINMNAVEIPKTSKRRRVMIDEADWIDIQKSTDPRDVKSIFDNIDRG